MLYLKDNPLLRSPLKLEHTKPRLLGHWGSDPGQCFGYVHFNRLISKYNLDAIYVSGPGHGAPAVLSQAYLEGTYSEVYPDNSEDVRGMLAIRNQVDRYSLAIDAIDRMPRFRVTGSAARDVLLNEQIACKVHATSFGVDRPEITNWKWPF